MRTSVWYSCEQFGDRVGGKKTAEIGKFLAVGTESQAYKIVEPLLWYWRKHTLASDFSLND